MPYSFGAQTIAEELDTDWHGEISSGGGFRRLSGESLGVEDYVILITVTVLIAITVVFDLVEEVS